MFLSLDPSDGDKSIMLVARNLAGDEQFDPLRADRLLYNDDAERPRVNRLMQDVHEALGKPFPMFVNQIVRKGTTGWEYSSSNYRAILKHALNVAQALKTPLNIHVDIMQEFILAAVALDVKHSIDLVSRVNPTFGSEDMDRANAKIAKAQYLAFSEVHLPPRFAVTLDHD